MILTEFGQKTTKLGQDLSPLYRECPLYGVPVLERFHCIPFVVSCFSDEILDVGMENNSATFSWVASGRMLILIYSITSALKKVAYCRHFSLPRRFEGGFRTVKSATESWEDEALDVDFTTDSDK